MGEFILNAEFGKRGFQIVFDNDVVVSVQFSPQLNYCVGDGSNAEVAVFLKNREWLSGWPHQEMADGEPLDDVQGHVTPDELVDIINWAKAYKVE